MSQIEDTVSAERKAEIEGLDAEAQRLPEVPKDAHQFGAAIESVRLMLARLSDAIAELKEEAALIRAGYAAEVRPDTSPG